MKSDRLPCCVPFCRRTISREKGYEQWVCGKHWRLVSYEARWAYSRAKRRAKRILRGRPEYASYWTLPPGSMRRRAAVRMWRRLDLKWMRCVNDAIESAGGLR
jgi:hypothetical protein